MGRLYASSGPWPASDPLLHTSDRAPVPHEWLFQVALHYARVASGFGGLRVTHALAVSVSLLLAFGIFRRAGRDVAVAACATAIFIALSWFRLFQLRPDLVSIPATLLLYLLWLVPEDGPSPRRIALGALLLLFWANAHSLFAVGLALVLAALLGTGLWALLGALARDGKRAARLGALARDGEGAAWLGPSATNTRRAGRLAIALAVGSLASLANPRGFAQHATFFVESEAGAIWELRDDFLRWDPFTPVLGNLALTPVAWALMNVLLLAFLLRSAWTTLAYLRDRSPERLRTLDPVHLGLGVAAFVACLVAVRFHWLCVFPLLYLVRARLPLHWPAALLAPAVAFGVVSQAGFAAVAREIAREPAGYRAPWLDARYAGAGARFLTEAGLEGRLFNPFNLGGFLGYWLAPELRTFIDGRLDHIPARVLDDYRTARRTSLAGPTHILRGVLDRYDVEIFFADTFPEREYRGRQSAFHLRRLREWIPVHAGRSHTIYLRRGPTQRQNLARVVEYYARLGVPFDALRGLDVSEVVREAPGWAQRQGLVHPDRARLGDLRGDERAAALATLAAHAWRVGHFADQVELDRELVTLRPGDPDARRRLADGLLHLGLPRAARPVARAFWREHPDDPEALYLYNVAREGAQAGR